MLHIKKVKETLHYENMTLKIRVTLKIESTKDMNNAENIQWDYKHYENNDTGNHTEKSE